MTETIAALRALGYEVAADGDRLHLRYARDGSPPADQVRPLVERLRADKPGALAALAAEKDPRQPGCNDCNSAIVGQSGAGGTENSFDSNQSPERGLLQPPKCNSDAIVAARATSRTDAAGDATIAGLLQKADCNSPGPGGGDSERETDAPRRLLHYCTIAVPPEGDISAASIIATLRAAGFAVFLNGDHLGIDAQGEVRADVSPLIPYAQTHQDEIVDALRAEVAEWRVIKRAPSEFAASARPAPCDDCGRPVLIGLSCCYACLLVRDAA